MCLHVGTGADDKDTEVTIEWVDPKNKVYHTMNTSWKADWVRPPRTVLSLL